MSARGFTLLEVLVGAAISLLVIGLVLLTFLGQQRAFQAVDLNQMAGRTERDALLDMENALRRAGWGIDPRYAFDFNSYACTAPCRDSATGPDEMVFVARNPNYRWQDNGVGTCATVGGCYNGNAWGIQSATATSVTLVTTNAGDQFHKGRVVLGVCPNGSNATMGTITTTVTTASPVFAQTLQLQPSAADAYHANGFSGTACFTQPGATLFLVDRFRYAIRSYNNVPWLVLDTGLDLNLDGVLDANDFTPIAQGVEDMQIAYALNVGTQFGMAAPDNNTNWVVGDTPGIVEEPNPLALAPTYTSATNAPERFNLHPANIRSVRVTLGVRSINPDPSQPGYWTGDHLLLSENRNVPALATVATDKLRRFHIATSVYARDMESRSNFIF